MENFTDKIACLCLLEKLQEIEPNINNQFEAYGVLCQRFYNKYKEGGISKTQYLEAMISLNEGREILLSTKHGVQS